MAQMVGHDTPIEELPGVGARNLNRLHKLGIRTVGGLIRHFPVRYENYQETTLIANAEPGSKVNVQGEILTIATKRIFPRRLNITTAVIRDSSGAIKVAWFNQPYIENQLPPGTLVSLAGKVTNGKNGIHLSSPTYERLGYGQRSMGGQVQAELKHTSGLVPVYPETEGITSKYLRFLIKPLLSKLSYTDSLPTDTLKRLGLPEFKQAIQDIHYPSTTGVADKARERFAFEDLLLFQLKSLLERRRLNQFKSVPINFNENLIKTFVASLPFELTGDQKVAAYEILNDLGRSYPMNRLMEGDVGSGKTVVALIAAFQTVNTNHQAVFMAPTEVLAQQHYKTITSLINNTGPKKITVALISSGAAILGDEKTTKTATKKAITEGRVDIVVGTHAVIQKDVKFKNLALAIIDEQHRFGINQRKALAGGSVNNGEIDTVPHLLSMTATPIPRTLALTIYGDLDISIIKEKPKDRQKIMTKVVPPSHKKSSYQFMRDEISKGRQVFVVCPRIEVSNGQKPTATSPTNRREQMKLIWADVKAVQEEHKKLSEQIFPDLKVAMLHGKLKPKEKSEIMDKFKNREFDILVSTSVIEVGVDIPNATIMAIESAERFGLAQLHQFRGRVGRAEHQSYCFLLTSSAEKSINQRLKALVEFDDGFLLAEKDMKLRGPGEFLGVKQSGMPDLAMASLSNIELIKKARNEARLLLKENPSLDQYPILKSRLDSLQRLVHFE